MLTDSSILGLSGKLGKHTMVGGFYARLNSKDLALMVINKKKNVYGFNADTNFDKVWVGGEWLKDSHC